MLKVGEKLGNTTELTLLMDDLYHTIPVFPLPSLWWILFYLVSVSFHDTGFDFVFMVALC